MSETRGPKYPDVAVSFTGENGNAMNLIGIVQRALRRAGVSQAERDAFFADATSGDYDHVLQTCMRWVEVD